MASISPASLSCTPESHTSKHGYVKLTITGITQSVATNETTIDYKITVEGTPWVALHALYVTLGGRVLYSNTSDSIKTNWSAGDIIKSGTETFTNSDDGSLTLNAYIKQLFYYTWSSQRWSNPSFYQSLSVNMVCSSIPRKVEITSAPDFTTEENPTIYYSNKAGSAVTSVEACISFDGSNDDIPYRPISMTDNSYPFNFTPEERTTLRNYCNNSKSKTVKFYVRTLLGGTTYWSIENRTLTIVENPATKPSVELVISLDNTTIPSSVRSTFDGMYIQGKSKVAADITASGTFNATISSYSTSIDGKTYTTASFTSDLLTSPGTQVIRSTVADSRVPGGFTNFDEKTISVYEYSKPKIAPISGATEISCYRSDASGNPTNNSNQIWLKAKKSFYPLDNKNSCTLRYRYKLSSEAWGNQQWNTLTTTDNEYNALLGNTFPVTNAYTIQVGVIDTFGEYDSLDFDIPTDDIPLHLGAGGKSVGIGKYADTTNDNSVSVGWDTVFDGDVTVDGKTHLGEVYISGNKLEDYVVYKATSGIWTYEKWASGKAVCYGKDVSSVVIDTETLSGSGWYTTAQGSEPVVTFPTGLFAEAPQVHIQWQQDTGYYPAVVIPRTVTTSQVTYQIFRNAQFPAGYTSQRNIYAVGIWTSTN